MPRYEPPGDHISDRERSGDQRFPISHDSLLDLFYQLEVAIGNTQKARKGEYTYIPFSHGEFVAALTPYKEAKNYIEVGCGIGSKLWLARNVVKIKGHITGVEINEKYAEIAKNLTNMCYQTSVLNCDAFDVDYSSYDLIYSYDPLKDSDKLFTFIKKHMKSKAVFIRAHCFNSGSDGSRFDRFTKE